LVVAGEYLEICEQLAKEGIDCWRDLREPQSR
jgi:hypothetical protein